MTLKPKAAIASTIAGAACILLSSYAQTPLGRIAYLSIIDALYVAVAMRRFEGSVQALERSNEIVEARRLGESRSREG